MKQGHKKLALLGTVLITLFLAGQALASGLDGASDADASVQSCRYYYWLEDEDPNTSGESAAEGTWRYNLYVARTDPEGKLLHTGYIALAAEADALSFEPSTAQWDIFSVAPDSDTIQSDPETGTFEGSRYISFGWDWVGEDLTDSAAGDMQLLGTVILEGKKPLLEDIELLEWYNTPAGSRLIAAWQDEVAKADDGDPSADPTPYWEVVDRTWRFESSVSYDGYYQGYYDAESELDKDVRVDLLPGWQGFRVGAYAPERPITLTFCNPNTGEVEAKADHRAGDGIGHFKTRIDFKKLSYTDKDGHELEGFIPSDTYTLVISKPSHVQCTIPDLTFDTGECTLLLGVYIELPCGNVDNDSDIQQDDRAQLTAPEIYRKTYKAIADEALGPDQEPCDLDGDHRVDQTDLAILIAPANYGRQSFIYRR